jgi:PHP family Zn ribbon phosphoesterase
MSPGNIVGLALEYGLDIVAVTDHNSGANARAVSEFAAGTGLVVWPGMEVQTKEEVHLVVLADDLDLLEDWQELVYRHLPSRPNRPDVFGEQTLFDKEGRVTGVLERLLLTSVDLSVDEVRREARRRGLVCYPAHVDRPAYGYISNLGFLPPASDFDLIEVSSRLTLGEVKAKLPSLEGRTIVISSDAHRLEELGPARTWLHMGQPTLDEFRAAIVGRDGRKVEAL